MEEDKPKIIPYLLKVTADMTLQIALNLLSFSESPAAALMFGMCGLAVSGAVSLALGCARHGGSRSRRAVAELCAAPKPGRCLLLAHCLAAASHSPLLCHTAMDAWLLTWDLTQLSRNMTPLTASLILYHMIQHVKIFPPFAPPWKLLTAYGVFSPCLIFLFVCFFLPNFILPISMHLGWKEWGTDESLTLSSWQTWPCTFSGALVAPSPVLV